MKAESRNRDDLRTLVHSMELAEVKYVAKVLLMQSGRKENMLLKLLWILYKDKNNVLIEEKILKKLYEQKVEKKTSYRMLKSRLKQRIYDSILHESNIERPIELEEVSRINIKLRKKISLAYFLFGSRNTPHLVDQLIEEIIALAKKYERYDTLVEILHLKRFIHGSKFGRKKYDKISKEIQHWKICENARSIAWDISFRQVMSWNCSSGFQDLVYQETLINDIEILRKLYDESRSIFVLYSMLEIEFELAFYTKEFNKAKAINSKLINLVRTKPSVYKKNRLGLAYLAISGVELILGNFNKAIKYIFESRRSFQSGTKNYYISMEMEFLISFYSNRNSDNIQLIKILPTDSESKEWNFIRGKNSYYKANVYFKSGRFNETLKELRANTYLSDDKTGWDFGLRVLLIMTFIEMGNYDEASSAIEALRKHVDRSSKKTFMRSRDKLIFDFIRSLDNNSFDFHRTANKKQKLMEQLESKEKHLAWEYFTHELFPFQDWVKSKLKTETLMFNKAI